MPHVNYLGESLDETVEDSKEIMSVLHRNCETLAQSVKVFFDCLLDTTRYCPRRILNLCLHLMV